MSTERVARFRDRQRMLGRKPVTFYLAGDAIRAIKSLSRAKTQGEIVELAIQQLTNKTDQLNTVMPDVLKRN